jgi:hypothetical protein
MRQLPPSSECSHEEHDAPKVLRLDHLHRVITTNSDTLRRRREGPRSYVRPHTHIADLLRKPCAFYFLRGSSAGST